MTFSIPEPFLIPEVPNPEFRENFGGERQSTNCKIKIIHKKSHSWFLNGVPALKPRQTAAFLIPGRSIYTYRDILTISPCMFIKAKGRNRYPLYPLLMEIYP
jgi:hypothetical protein